MCSHIICIYLGCQSGECFILIFYSTQFFTFKLEINQIKYINSMNSFFFLNSKVSETSSVSVYRKADTKPKGQSETGNLITGSSFKKYHDDG